MNKNNPKFTREWHLIDASEEVLGRISTKIANLLRGKEKKEFSANLDCGDYVVVINSKKVKLTGNKEEEKRYFKHTGYLGNLKEKSVPELREKNPNFIVRHAVLGMLPKNRLQKEFIKRLKIYPGGEHPHQNIKFVNKN